MNVLSEIHLAVARGFSALHSVFGRRYPGSFGFVEKCYDFCEKPSLTAEDGLGTPAYPSPRLASVSIEIPPGMKSMIL